MKKTEIYRILDVNLNRTREGLRVIEDTLRFTQIIKSKFLTVRRIRHKLTTLSKSIYPHLLCARDSRTDPGVIVKENQLRPNVRAVLIANFRRVQESIRVLEEYSKLNPETVHVSTEFKKLRFKIYALEKEILTVY